MSTTQYEVVLVRGCSAEACSVMLTTLYKVIKVLSKGEYYRAGFEIIKKSFFEYLLHAKCQNMNLDQFLSGYINLRQEV